MANAKTHGRSELAVEGMTCSACANRIQRQLNKLDDVDDAQVNFATGKATVRHGGSVDEERFRDVIEGLGYGVAPSDADSEGEHSREDDLWRRFSVALALSLPTMVISMVEAAQYSGWEWVVAALATPVIFWSGWPFHRAALTNLRHGATTMDTLVSMGSMSAWLWSTAVLVGDIDGGHIYYETGAVIVTLIFLGKWFESRATRRSGDEIRALAELGVRRATLDDGR